MESALAPGLLVAAPALRDPNFDGALVLMAEHHAEGALGFVVNRLSTVSVVEVLDAVDEALLRAARAAGRASGTALAGGPVQPERLWILFRPGRVPDADSVRLGPALALGGSRELLESLVRTPDGGPFLLVLGYAGWAPMQLEREVSAGAWVPMALEPDLVFDVPTAERWPDAVRRLGLDPEAFIVGGGGAEA
jgi:putative transcriptional regulator